MDRHNKIIKLGFSNHGYKAKVHKEFQPHCKVCLKEIPKAHEFYYCPKTLNFWCYNCRGKEWHDVFSQRGSKTSCSLENNHEHFFINEIEKTNT